MTLISEVLRKRHGGSASAIYRNVLARDGFVGPGDEEAHRLSLRLNIDILCNYNVWLSVGWTDVCILGFVV